MSDNDQGDKLDDQGDQLDGVQLTDDVSEDRASLGRFAIYDTQLQRFVGGVMGAADVVEDVPGGGRVSRTGRYQLRRV